MQIQGILGVPLLWLDRRFTPSLEAVAELVHPESLDQFRCLRVPDSPENRAHFGSANAGKERGISGYPLVRAVALMALRSHLVAATRFGPYATDERVMARELMPQVPDRSLLILDRNYPGAGLLLPFAGEGEGRHWLVRATKTLKWRVLAELGPGDALVEMNVPREARRERPTLPKTWRARAIAYQRERGEPL